MARTARDPIHRGDEPHATARSRRGSSSGPLVPVQKVYRVADLGEVIGLVAAHPPLHPVLLALRRGVDLYFGNDAVTLLGCVRRVGAETPSGLLVMVQATGDGADAAHRFERLCQWWQRGPMRRARGWIALGLAAPRTAANDNAIP